jgi:hypothetical protein
MTDRTLQAPQQIAARVAGFMYVLIIITSLLSMIMESRLIVPEDVATTASQITAKDLLFRVSIASDLFVFAGVVVLSLALFVILKTVDRNLALLALYWRLAEAILGAVTVLIGHVVLLLLNGEDYLAVFDAEQLQALVGVFLNVRSAGFDIVIVFLCLGSVVFCYLFLKAMYVPRILAVWGITAYTLMLIYVSTTMLVPNHDATAYLQIVCYLPVTLFELVFGLWLLIKGVNVQPTR